MRRTAGRDGKKVIEIQPPEQQEREVICLREGEILVTARAGHVSQLATQRGERRKRADVVVFWRNEASSSSSRGQTVATLKRQRRVEIREAGGDSWAPWRRRREEKGCAMRRHCLARSSIHWPPP